MSDSSSLSDHDHDDKKEEVDPGLSNPSVIDKYRDAAKVANRVMKELIELSGIGANVYELCAKGDELIELYVKEFHGKVKSKGVAFPTSVSVNNCCGNYSPMSQNESISLKQGDVAKIDLGVHIDGYISTVAHTIVVGTFENPITGSIADVICAAYFASQCAIRLIKPGKTNTEVTNAILRCAQVFNVNPLQGVLSHQLTRDNIDEKKVIINKAEVDQVVEEFQFELNQVYSVDIVMSTGEGKSRQIDSKTTIYKRNKDVSYNLKNNSSRKLFSDIKNKHNTRPFNVRNFPVRERVGMKELINHELVHAYPVLYEKNNQIVAQFKFTVLILSSSTQNINEDFPLPWVTSDYKLESDTFLSQIMSTSTKNKKKKKKKPAKKTKTENVPQEETKEPIVQEEKQGETN